MLRQIFLSLLRIYGLCKKEFLTIVMDKGSLQVLIVPIIMQCLIFGYGASFELKHIPFVYFDNSQSKLSTDLVFEIENTPHFELLKKCPSRECVKDSVDKQEVLLGIIFEDDFMENRSVNLILDARNTASANTAQSYVQNIVNTYSEKNKLGSFLKIENRYRFNPNNITRFSILTAMVLTLSVIQVLMLSGLSISREREEGSYDMMLMTPTTPLEILLGKALPTIIIAFLQSMLSLAICVFYFDIPMQGSLFEFILCILCFAFSVVGMGMMVSVFAKNPMQSMIICFLLIMPMVMCSGMITPVDAMPDWFHLVVYLDPLYYGLTILWRIYLEGMSLSEIWVYILPLIISGFFTMSLCVYLFRRKLE